MMHVEGELTTGDSVTIVGTTGQVDLRAIQKAKEIMDNHRTSKWPDLIYPTMYDQTIKKITLKELFPHIRMYNGQ